MSNNNNNTVNDGSPHAPEYSAAAEPSTQNVRRLKAIFFADVYGYTRHMGRDEETTQATVNRYIQEFERACERHGGEVLQVMGDGVYAIFDSVTNAVSRAMEFQDFLEDQNQSIPEEDRILFRIGIHLGDVMYGSGSYFGDSVIIASRLESIANPGGVCISRAVYEQVKNKLPYGFEFLGAQRLKNLAEAVDTYNVHRETNKAVMIPSQRTETVSAPLSPSARTMLERSAIVVLPFQNRSGDPEQEYFSDGISEDIITNLSRFHNLFVISRGSAFTYKNKQTTPHEVGRELGVRYVVEGSVRTLGNKIRITVQLIDATTEQTLWGERYDRQIDDLFAVQDEITEYIVGASAVQIETAERERMEEQPPPPELEAYSRVLLGQRSFFRYTRAGNREAHQHYEAARKADPRYARAIAAISRIYNIDWRYAWAESPDKALDDALTYARSAVELDKTDSRGHSELGFVYLYRKEHDLAINAYKRAMTLNPNDADVMSDAADCYTHYGESEKAIDLLTRAMLLNPYYPDQYLWHMAGAYYNLKRYEDVIESVMKMNNPAEGRRLTAAAFGQLGMEAEARRHAQMVLEVHPNFSLENWAKVQPDRNPDDTEHFVEGLKKAGL